MRENGNLCFQKYARIITITLLTGIMDATVYVDILEKTLLPFIEAVYPDSFRFMQDNDPKHTSKLGQQFLKDNKEDINRSNRPERHREFVA